MIGENRQLVTNEPVEFWEIPVEVQDCRKITDHYRGIYRIYPNLIKENRRMSICNRLDLQTLGFRPVMPKNLPDHWREPSSFNCGVHARMIFLFTYWQKCWEHSVVTLERLVLQEIRDWNWEPAIYAMRFTCFWKARNNFPPTPPHPPKKMAITLRYRWTDFTVSAMWASSTTGALSAQQSKHRLWRIDVVCVLEAS